MRKELDSICESEGAKFSDDIFHGVRDSWKPGSFETGILVDGNVAKFDAENIKNRISD